MFSRQLLQRTLGPSRTTHGLQQRLLSAGKNPNPPSNPLTKAERQLSGLSDVASGMSTKEMIEVLMENHQLNTLGRSINEKFNALTTQITGVAQKVEQQAIVQAQTAKELTMKIEQQGKELTTKVYLQGEKLTSKIDSQSEILTKKN